MSAFMGYSPSSFPIPLLLVFHDRKGGGLRVNPLVYLLSISCLSLQDFKHTSIHNVFNPCICIVDIYDAFYRILGHWFRRVLKVHRSNECRLCIVLFIIGIAPFLRYGVLVLSTSYCLLHTGPGLWTRVTHCVVGVCESAPKLPALLADSWDLGLESLPTVCFSPSFLETSIHLVVSRCWSGTLALRS